MIPHFLQFAKPVEFVFVLWLLTHYRLAIVVLPKWKICSYFGIAPTCAPDSWKKSIYFSQLGSVRHQHKEIAACFPVNPRFRPSMPHLTGVFEAVEKVSQREEAPETRGGGMRSTSVNIVLFVRFLRLQHDFKVNRFAFRTLPPPYYKLSF
jgi:hypothetical protein